MVLNEGLRKRDSQSRPAGSSTAMFLKPLSAMLCSRSAFAVARRRPSRRAGDRRREGKGPLGTPGVGR
jgi:hypothetical protein